MQGEEGVARMASWGKHTCRLVTCTEAQLTLFLAQDTPDQGCTAW